MQRNVLLTNFSDFSFIFRTYGRAVLLLYVAAKMELIASIGDSEWVLGGCRGGGPAILDMHGLALLTSPILIRRHDYVDEHGPKSRFYGFFVEARLLVTWHHVIIYFVSSVALVIAAYGRETAAVLVACVMYAAFLSGRYADYPLDGVMGDYLGATIYVTEIALLGSFSSYMETAELISPPPCDVL